MSDDSWKRCVTRKPPTAVKPTDMDELHGFLWPDGAPLLCPPENELVIFRYRDALGGEFAIAYTRDQVDEQFVFCPYIPLLITTGSGPGVVRVDDPEEIVERLGEPNAPLPDDKEELTMDRDEALQKLKDNRR